MPKMLTNEVLLRTKRNPDILTGEEISILADEMYRGRNYIRGLRELLTKSGIEIPKIETAETYSERK